MWMECWRRHVVQWDLEIRSLRISTTWEEWDVFAKEQFEKRVVIGNYSGTLIYTNLYENKDVRRRYWVEVMSLSFKKFHTPAVHISNDMKAKMGRVATF